MGGMDPLDSQLRFVLEADRLKSVLRRSTLNDGSRRENSAEHSWHLALMALVLGDHAPPGTDLGKVSAMVVLHDLVEIDAGDLYVYADEAAQRRQAVAERAAADRLFGLLPPGQGTALRALWDEFEQRITPEARFARALDRLQPLIANYEAGGTDLAGERHHRGSGAGQGPADRGWLGGAGPVRPQPGLGRRTARHPAACPGLTHGRPA